MVLAVLSSAPAGAATGWGTYTPLGPEGGYRDAALTATDELVAAVSTEQGTVVAMQPAGGGSTALQNVGLSASSSIRLVADGQGNAFLTGVDPDGNLHLLTRAPRGTFTVDRTFAGPVSRSGLAVNPRGDVLVLWITSAGSFAAVRDAGGAWREAVRLPDLVGHPVVRLSNSGWALIAWPGSQEASMSDPLALVMLSPSGDASAPIDLHAGHEGGPVTMVMDDAGHFAVGWAESDGAGYVYEGPLVIAYGGNGAITKRLSLGSGEQLSIAANRHGDALVTWRLPADTYYVSGVQINRMAKLDLRDGGIGADEPAPVEPGITTVSDAGDRMIVGGMHSHKSSRARRGGLLRAALSFGCDLNPSRPQFGAIDSRGQGVVIAQPVPSPWTTGAPGPHVIRDHPEDFWNPFSCGGVTRPSPIPTHLKAVAGQPLEIRMTTAIDPEASSEQFEWDFGDDEIFETNTGPTATTRHIWPKDGRHALRVQQVRWFGETRETRSWRIEVEVTPSPVPPGPSIAISKRSLRQALRRGLDLTVQIPVGGRTRFEVRRLLGGSRTSVLGRKTRTIEPGTRTKIRIQLAKPRRRLKKLRIEVRAVQGRKRLAAARATLR
jgi:hypothetical protein